MKYPVKSNRYTANESYNNRFLQIQLKEQRGYHKSKTHTYSPYERTPKLRSQEISRFGSITKYIGETLNEIWQYGKQIGVETSHQDVDPEYKPLKHNGIDEKPVTNIYTIKAEENPSSPIGKKSSAQKVVVKEPTDNFNGTPLFKSQKSSVPVYWDSDNTLSIISAYRSALINQHSGNYIRSSSLQVPLNPTVSDVVSFTKKRKLSDTSSDQLPNKTIKVEEKVKEKYEKLEVPENVNRSEDSVGHAVKEELGFPSLEFRVTKILGLGDLSEERSKRSGFFSGDFSYSSEDENTSKTAFSDIDIASNEAPLDTRQSRLYINESQGSSLKHNTLHRRLADEEEEITNSRKLSKLSKETVPLDVSNISSDRFGPVIAGPTLASHELDKSSPELETSTSILPFKLGSEDTPNKLSSEKNILKPSEISISNISVFAPQNILKSNQQGQELPVILDTSSTPDAKALTEFSLDGQLRAGATKPSPPPTQPVQQGQTLFRIPSSTSQPPDLLAAAEKNLTEKNFDITNELNSGAQSSNFISNDQGASPILFNINGTDHEQDMDISKSSPASLKQGDFMNRTNSSVPNGGVSDNKSLFQFAPKQVNGSATPPADSSSGNVFNFNAAPPLIFGSKPSAANSTPKPSSVFAFPQSTEVNPVKVSSDLTSNVSSEPLFNFSNAHNNPASVFGFGSSSPNVNNTDQGSNTPNIFAQGVPAASSGGNRKIAPMRRRIKR